jgi:hypothetical protein
LRYTRCLPGGLLTFEGVEEPVTRTPRRVARKHYCSPAGKTLANYAEALGASCDWCVQRGYLAADPLQSLVPFDTTLLTQRRTMTAEEITRLLAACTPHRQLLLETVFLSGLRAADSMLSNEKHVHSMYRQAVGAETESATPFDIKELRLSENGGGGGNRTPRRDFRYKTDPLHKPYKSHIIPCRVMG